jgi:hypothetical protein
MIRNIDEEGAAFYRLDEESRQLAVNRNPPAGSTYRWAEIYTGALPQTNTFFALNPLLGRRFGGSEDLSTTRGLVYLGTTVFTSG